MQVDMIAMYLTYYIPLPKLFPSQFDHALRKDVFFLNTFTETYIFVFDGR